MKTPIFLRNKVSRLLKESGLKYTFISEELDEYNQPIKSSNTITITGIYHESFVNITVTSADASSIAKRRTPAILTLLDDTSKLIKQGDYITINDVEYRVQGAVDIQQYGVAVDIALEEVVKNG